MCTHAHTLTHPWARTHIQTYTPIQHVIPYTYNAHMHTHKVIPTETHMHRRVHTSTPYSPLQSTRTHAHTILRGKMSSMLLLTPAHIHTQHGSACAHWAWRKEWARKEKGRHAERLKVVREQVLELQRAGGGCVRSPDPVRAMRARHSRIRICNAGATVDSPGRLCRHMMTAAADVQQLPPRDCTRHY